MRELTNVVSKDLHLMLCQDCLKVAHFESVYHDEEKFCICDGQMCGCPTCSLKAHDVLEFGDSGFS